LHDQGTNCRTFKHRVDDDGLVSSAHQWMPRPECTADALAAVIGGESSVHETGKFEGNPPELSALWDEKKTAHEVHKIDMYTILTRVLLSKCEGLRWNQYFDINRKINLLSFICICSHDVLLACMLLDFSNEQKRCRGTHQYIIW